MSIKSIEILQDGASAVYGSDAIGGVMNIITADDYDTFKISGYGGQYGEGDGGTSEFDMRMGANGERGRGLLDISYTNQEPVNTADRPTSEFPIPGFPFGVSSGAAMGRFIFLDPVVGDFVSVAPNPGVANPVYTFGNPDTDDFHPFALEDRFNYQPYNHLVTPNERINVFAKGEYDIADHVKFRALASFNNRTSQGRAAPVPLFMGPGAGSTFYMNNVVWDAAQIYNPFGMTLDATNMNFIARTADRGGSAHLQPGRGHLVPVRRLRRRFLGRRPHDVLGRHGHQVREQRAPDQAQPVQRAQHQHRDGRSGGLRRDPRLRAAQHRRRRLDHARRCWTTSPTRASTPAARRSSMSRPT